jgi:hypothetical protein
LLQPARRNCVIRREWNRHIGCSTVGIMRRLLALLVLCAATTTASADGFYLTESVGGADVGDELAQYMSSALRLRISAGVRRGRWAFEGWIAGYLGADRVEPTPCSACGGHAYRDVYHPTSLTTYGFDLKYLSPIHEHVDIYLRGGLARGRMFDGDGEHAGRGIGAGAGIQVKGKVRALGFLAWPLFFTDVGPKITAALYLDTGAELYRLHPGGGLDTTPAIDAKLHTTTIGFAAGSDF